MTAFPFGGPAIDAASIRRKVSIKMIRHLRKHARTLPFALFGLIGIAPILIAMTAGWIARVYGFELHEGAPPDDSERARTLYRLGVAGWYFLYTLPLALALSVVYAICLQIHERLRVRRIPPS